MCFLSALLAGSPPSSQLGSLQTGEQAHCGEGEEGEGEDGEGEEGRVRKGRVRKGRVRKGG